MKISLGWVGWILFAGALVVIFFLRSCSPKPSNQVKVIPGDKVFVKGQTDTFWKTPEKVYVRQPGIPYPVYQKDTEYLPAKPLTHADTIEAAKKYYITSIYLDTLRSQQVILALRDSIGMNKILGRTFQIKNTRPIQQVITNPEKFKIFLGANFGLSTTLKSAIVMPSLMLETKTDKVYTLSYEVLSKAPCVGMYFKIHLGK